MLHKNIKSRTFLIKKSKHNEINQNILRFINQNSEGRILIKSIRQRIQYQLTNQQNKLYLTYFRINVYLKLKTDNKCSNLSYQIVMKKSKIKTEHNIHKNTIQHLNYTQKLRIPTSHLSNDCFQINKSIDFRYGSYINQTTTKAKDKTQRLSKASKEQSNYKVSNIIKQFVKKSNKHKKTQQDNKPKSDVKTKTFLSKSIKSKSSKVYTEANIPEKNSKWKHETQLLRFNTNPVIDEDELFDESWLSNYSYDSSRSVINHHQLSISCSISDIEKLSQFEKNKYDFNSKMMTLKEQGFYSEMATKIQRAWRKYKTSKLLKNYTKHSKNNLQQKIIHTKMQKIKIIKPPSQMRLTLPKRTKKQQKLTMQEIVKWDHLIQMLKTQIENPKSHRGFMKKLENQLFQNVTYLKSELEHLEYPNNNDQSQQNPSNFIQFNKQQAQQVYNSHTIVDDKIIHQKKTVIKQKRKDIQSEELNKQKLQQKQNRYENQLMCPKILRENLQQDRASPKSSESPQISIIQEKEIVQSEEIENKRLFPYIITEQQKQGIGPLIVKQLLFQMLFEQIFQKHNILVHFLSKMAQQAQSPKKKFEERKKKRKNQFIMKQFRMTSSQIIQFSRQLKRGLLNESFHLLLNLQKPRGVSGIEILRYLHGNAMINDQQRQYMSQEMGQQRISSYRSNHSHISSKSSFSNNEKNQDEEIVTIIPNYVFNQIWEIKKNNYDSYFINIEKSQSDNNKIQFMKYAIQIFYRAIFDSYNQLLDLQRMHGEFGKPFPWKTSPSFDRKLERQQMETKVHKVSKKIQRFSSTLCGVMLQQSDIKQFKSSQSVCIAQFQLDRQSKMIKQDLIQQDPQWLFYDDEQVEILLQISDYLQVSIMEEFFAQFLQLSSLFLQKLSFNQ